MTERDPGTVVAVSTSSHHTFHKTRRPGITLLAGLGVEGDAHLGVTVKHRSRVARDPSRPNLRQVHLIHSELLEELAALDLAVEPGDLGENVTTRGVDPLDLPAGTLLRLGEAAVVEVTGLRNPCLQIETFRRGLLSAVLGRHADGSLLRKTGVMGIVRVGGEVGPGDRVGVELPPRPHRKLRVV